MSDDTAHIRAALDDARGLAEALGLLDGRRGRDWQSQPGGVLVLCPWHDERSPSCSITLGPDGTVRPPVKGGAGGIFAANPPTDWNWLVERTSIRR